jgi:hypothetical protein
MHLFNNGIIVVLASVPDPVGAAPDPTAPPPFWLVPAAVVALGVGVKILRDLPNEHTIQPIAYEET